VHLTAIAGRAGIRIDRARLNALSESTPVLLDLKPTGEHYMEDFHAAGGMPAILRELKPLLHLDCPTVGGLTIGEVIEAVGWSNTDIVRPLDRPIDPVGGLIALEGSLAPNGALLKRA